MKNTSHLPQSLRRIVNAAQRDGIKSPADAAEVLRRSNVSLSDLMPWANYDHSVLDSYGRRPVMVGPNFELMVMSWESGDFSAIHDHGHTQWGAVMHFGHAEHAVYENRNEQLRTEERTMMEPGQINPVNHDLIHQMGNPTNERFLSLHLYGCADPVDGVTGDARIFDLLNNEIQLTDGGVFYCLPESQINGRLPGVAADAETTREHHQQMLDRLFRIQSSIGLYDPHRDLIGSRLVTELQRLDAPAEILV